MRPKKTILLYCPNEITREVLLCQMRVWGYRVTCAELAELALEQHRQRFDLVLMLPGYEQASWKTFHKVAELVALTQRERFQEIRIYDTLKVLTDVVAPSVLRIPVTNPCAEYLREMLRLALSRKRGPRVFRHELTAPIHGPVTTEQKMMVAYGR